MNDGAFIKVKSPAFVLLFFFAPLLFLTNCKPMPEPAKPNFVNCYEKFSVNNNQALEKFSQQQIIGHAGGRYNSFGHGNALQAYKWQDWKYLEVDFSKTRDGHYVALHDWGKTWDCIRWGFTTKDMERSPSNAVPTREEFLKARSGIVRTVFSPLLLDEVDATLNSAPLDARIVVDLKAKRLAAMKVFKNTVKYPTKYIFYVEKEDEIVVAKELGFGGVILFGDHWIEHEKAIFAMKAQYNDFIFGLAFEKNQLYKFSNFWKIRDLMMTYAYTVNDFEEMMNLREQGVQGFVSDVYYPQLRR